MECDNPDMTDPAHKPLASTLRRVRSVGLLTLLSRVLGLVRDGVMAMQFGNGAISDAFSIAFRVPNMARQIFGEGALSTAFLPIFIRDLEQHGRETAYRTATAVLMAVTLLLLGIVLAVEVVVFALWATLGLSPEARLLLELLATLTPYLLMVCVLAQVSAVMHGLGEFTLPALGPVILNAVWIAVTWWLGRVIEAPETRIFWVAASIVLIGVGQLVLCLPALRMLGFRFARDWSASRDRVREIARTMLPVVLGLSITQLNTMTDSLFAWAFTAPADGSHGWLNHYPLNEGTAHAMYLGQRMLQFPIGVFGAALGTVIFPVLTLHAERKQWDHFRDDLTHGLLLVIAIGIPASIGLVLIAEPLTVLLFQHGQFDAEDSIQTAGIIATYSLGVWSACGLMIVQRAFYAIGDRRSPLRIGLWIAGLNLLMNLALVWTLGGRGLALATTLASMAQCVVTLVLLQAQTQGLDWSRLKAGLTRTLLATGAMSLGCLATNWAIEHGQLPDSLGARAVEAGLPLIVGVATYLAVAGLIGLTEPFELLRISRRR